MKKLTFFVICCLIALLSCKGNKGETAPADSSDSLAVAVESIIEQNDTVPIPMFLMGSDKDKHLLMLYWSYIEEPVKEEWMDEEDFKGYHQSWAIQERFRRSAAQYTNLITDKGIVKVKFVDEVLKNPDGETPSIGEIHGREEIPSLCARFDYVNPKDRNNSSGCIIVTDSYLSTRKQLDIKYDQSGWNNPKSLPAEAVKKLEQKYGMKVDKTRLSATIGDSLIWGKLQFRGEYKNAAKRSENDQYALALDVLIKGNEVYSYEELGNYDASYGCTWNADDDGEYVGCEIMVAFEGPKGIELCFYRGAPESSAVGMFYLRGDQLVKYTYETYHNMIDEEIPVWKTDFEQMRKLYREADPENKYVELTKWSHVYIDYDNEWVWLRDNDDENGAFFIRKNGKFKLVAEETPNLKPSEMEKNGVHYLCLSGSAGGSATYTEIYAFKNGEQVERFNALCVAGEIDECHLNGRELSKEEGQAYLDNLPEGSEIHVWFKDIESNE